MTALAERIKALIRHDGPMSVATYMALALGDPEHGYYMTKEPFGTGGDFTTGPEISQMFGEIVGLWSLVVWQRMGSPGRVELVELGPGRGTLMADLLRAAAIRPSFVAACRVHLVETSPRLRAVQAATLAHLARPPIWHDSISSLPLGPAIVVANEFFDALPVRQFQRTGDGWRERVVGLDSGGELAFGLGMPGTDLPDAPPGAIREVSAAAVAIVAALSSRVATHNGALLAIDYGHSGGESGDTLQAIRSKVPDRPLFDPGNADITAHVDFDALAAAAWQSGAHVYGPLPQGEFLTRLGIAERAAILARGKPAETATEIEAAKHRLIASDAMGALFKAMVVAAPALVPPPFDSL